MTGKSFATIALFVALAMTVANAQTCNCENLMRCMIAIPNDLLYSTYQISSFYLNDPTKFVPSQVNAACTPIGALAEINHTVPTEHSRRSSRRANHKTQSSFLETTQSITEEDIYFCLQFDMDCIIAQSFEEDVLPYHQAYCENTLRAFFFADYFPNSNGEDDPFARQQYIVNADNFYYNVLYPKLECDF